MTDSPPSNGAALDRVEKAVTDKIVALDRLHSGDLKALNVRVTEGEQRLREHISQELSRLKEALSGAQRETEITLNNSDKAISKSEEANDKRFEQMRIAFERDINLIAERIRKLEEWQIRQASAGETKNRQQDLMSPWMVMLGAALLSGIVALITTGAFT